MYNLRVFHFLLMLTLIFDTIKKIQVTSLTKSIYNKNYTAFSNSKFTNTFAFNHSKYFTAKPVFRAKFYDETGKLIGSIGIVDGYTPIYIVSGEILFPKKIKQGMETQNARHPTAPRLFHGHAVWHQTGAAQARPRA